MTERAFHTPTRFRPLPASAESTMESHSGSPLNRWIWATTSLIASVLLVAQMSHVGHFRYSVVVGAILAAAAAIGILGAIGSLQLRGETCVHVSDLRVVLPRLGALLLAVVVLVASMSAAVVGVLPWPELTPGLLITASFIAVTVAGWYLLKALGCYGGGEPLARRRGLWVLLLTTLVQLPRLGSFSLIDPWETHYGEVARELIARDDWISLWWAQDGWFWSKPVLNFWIQAISFSLFGVNAAPDRMMAGVGSGLAPQPEWAARFPVFVMTAVAVYAVYKATAVVWGTRAGWLGAIVLATTPYWVLLSRQSMADMPYVAPLSVAMGLMLVAVSIPANRVLPRYGLRWRQGTVFWSAAEVLLGLVVLLVVLQVAYLLSRHVTLNLLGNGRVLSLHGDLFSAGSGMGNCGLPGNRQCSQHSPTFPDWQPYKSALLWTSVAALLVWLVRGERRARQVAFLGSWLCVALSAMAKGAPGLVLPVFVFAAFVVVTRRWVLLGHAQLLPAVLLIACVALPWFVQMYARHGAAFTDRLIFHDMYKRAFVHVHDTNAGDDVSFGYYIWQLGYGLFPWSGLSGVVLIWWMQEDQDGAVKQRHAATLLGLWLVVGFAMFSVSMTKFHHYILPVVPPIAVLVGILLDRMVPPRVGAPALRTQVHIAAVAAAVATLWVGVAAFAANRIAGTAGGSWGRLGGSVAAIVVAIVAIAILSRMLRVPSTPVVNQESMWREGLALMALVPLALVGRDFIVGDTRSAVGQLRLLQLFSYNYDRLWPQSVSFRSELIAFVIVAILVTAFLVRKQARRVGLYASCSLAVLWSVWVADVYLVQLAPHWGQRELVEAYYTGRANRSELLVAYQMNWKGENFYTGNRLPAFVSSGEQFKQWISSQKSKGENTMFFITEHSRVQSLRAELENPGVFEKLTNSKLNNKFVLVRVRFIAKQKSSPGAAG